jgi:RNA polymerase sigma-70 factor, ECF subfamily
MARGESTFCAEAGSDNEPPDDQFARADRDGRHILEDWSELELFAAVVSRSERAFTEMFRRHYRSVVWSSRMILANATEGEDIGAAVLFEFWREPERFDPTHGTVLSFLRLEAKDRSIHLVRTETSRSHSEQRDLREVRVNEFGNGALILPKNSPARLRGALGELPTAEREAIELAFFGGLSYVAMAQHLGLEEGTVKSRLRCGLARLRTAFLSHDRTSGERLEAVKKC